MKKLIYLTIVSVFTFSAFSVKAQLDMFDIDELANSITGTEKEEIDKTSDKITDNNAEENSDYISEYFDDVENAQKAQIGARQLLEQQPNVISLRDSQKRLIKEGEDKRKQLLQELKQIQEERQIEQITANSEITPEEKNEVITKKITEKYQSAPFGLFWGIDKEQTEQLGFVIRPAEREDYTNVYLVTNPKQNSDTFDIVTAIFGEQNKLWCIYAQSKPQKDTPQASDVIDLYNKYYKALGKKYGNAQQYFTPYTYTEEIQEGEEEPETVTRAGEIGNDNFLKQLQEGLAVLYATFENKELGITLGVSVDGDSQSYISIDYKNLQMMREEQQTKLNNLIGDI
ncbi:MAG: hypothetical protein IJ532_04465 [Alphaproteobacteria bacterium]|nr:hypothetical protein [Alphaproteobacteria bacterium]